MFAAYSQLFESLTLIPIALTPKLYIHRALPDKQSLIPIKNPTIVYTLFSPHSLTIPQHFYACEQSLPVGYCDRQKKHSSLLLCLSNRFHSFLETALKVLHILVYFLLTFAYA